MRAVSVSSLKARLGQYLKRVRTGEEVVVTERGKPVARLCPLPASGPTPRELDEMVKAGLIRLPEKPLPPDFFTRPKVKDPNGLLLKTLLEMREEER